MPHHSGEIMHTNTSEKYFWIYFYKHMYNTDQYS